MDLADLKARLQEHLTDGLVVVVGSGLSCAEGLPSMQELAEHLRAQVGPGLGAEAAGAWRKTEPLIKAEGLEAALLKIAPPAELEAQIAFETGRLIAARESEVVSAIFAGSRTLRLTRLVPHLLKPPTGLPIVTTNYDRLIEIAVEEAGLGADTMFSGRFAATLDEKESRLNFCRGVNLKGGKASFNYRRRALILKPHGSLDWYLRGDTPVCYAGELLEGTRLIITPGQNKFRNGYESPFDHHRARANDCIDRASRFLVVGYGFSDDHLETHLKPAIRGGKPTVMLAMSLTTKAEELAREYSNVTALDCREESGEEGTRALVGGQELFFPGLRLWDLEGLVSEVLEP